MSIPTVLEYSLCRTYRTLCILVRQPITGVKAEWNVAADVREIVDIIFVVFAGKVFQQIVGIPMGTNCAPLLADIFLYSYKQNLYSLCSQPGGNSWRLDSISHTGTSMMFCP